MSIHLPELLFLLLLAVSAIIIAKRWYNTMRHRRRTKASASVTAFNTGSTGYPRTVVAATGIGSYTKALTPSGVGLIVTKGSGHTTYFGGTYPSDMWGQFIMLYTTEGSPGVMIYTDEPSGAVSNWLLYGDELDITFNKPTTIYTASYSSFNIATAAADYKAFVSTMPFYPAGASVITDTRYFASDYTLNDNTLWQLLDNINGKKAVEMTSWRASAFDTDYPTFVPKAGNSYKGNTIDFAHMIYHYQTTHNTDVYPYFNAFSQDGASADYNSAWNIKKADGSYTSGVVGSRTLYETCPGASGFRNKLFTQWQALVDQNGAPLKGVYLDQLGNSRVCYNTGHDHAPGDCYGHINGVKALCALFKNAGARISAESISEVLLKYVDANLNEGTGGMSAQPNTYPLWNLVYGNKKIDIGWQSTGLTRLISAVTSGTAGCSRITSYQHYLNNGDSLTISGPTGTPALVGSGRIITAIIDANTYEIGAIAYTGGGLSPNITSNYAIGPAPSDANTLIDMKNAVETYGKQCTGGPPVYASGDVQTAYNDGNHPLTLAYINARTLG
jgi:hypothetical protein